MDQFEKKSKVYFPPLVLHLIPPIFYKSEESEVLLYLVELKIGLKVGQAILNLDDVTGLR